jgi:tetratricopeptide (TPR) repeat protein
MEPRMMARKLSTVASYLLAISAIVGTTPAQFAHAQRGINAAMQSQVVDNPHASDKRPIRLPKQGRTLPDKPIVYRNPFAANATMSLPQSQILPGPLSRWQKDTRPSNEATPIPAAFTLAAPNVPAVLNLVISPSTSDQHRLASPANHGTAPRAAADSSMLADPIHFATEQLAQPIWLTSGVEESDTTQRLARRDFVQLFTDDSSIPPPSKALQAIAVAADERPLISEPGNSPEGWLAEAQRIAGNAESAEEVSNVADLCERALKANPAAESAASLRSLASWAHNRRGEFLSDAGRTDAALRDFHAAISLDETNSLAIHNRAVTLAQLEDFDSALSDFDRVIDLNPGLAVAYRNRAELLAAHGSMEEAVEDYTRAIEGSPEDAELLRARAHAWQYLGEFDRALEDLNLAIQSAPEPQSYVQRGNLMASQCKFDEALSDFQRALSIDSNLLEGNRSLAWLQATCPVDRIRDAEQALVAGQRAAKLAAADDYLTLDVLAAAQANAGHFDEAIATQQQAIAVAPDEFVDPLRYRLAIYGQQQPFRDDAE